MEKSKKEVDCKHWVQYTIEDKNGTVYQVCKRCKRRVIVREGKLNV